MGTEITFAPGQPCWFELATTDQADAKRFYSQLFGWNAVDEPIGPDAFYTLFKLEGRDVGAAFSMPPAMRAGGRTPHWGVLFAIPNVDEAAARVTQLGGQVLHAPFDVDDSGRLSVCLDPGGAGFSLWQGSGNHGVDLIDQPGTVGWTELATWDVPQAQAFYTGLFNWETHPSGGMETYIEFATGGARRGGLLPMDDHWKGMPSAWGIYFIVTDCDAVVARLKELGGSVQFGPFDAPGVGRIAIVADPQGAGFSVIALFDRR